MERPVAEGRGAKLARVSMGARVAGSAIWVAVGVIASRGIGLAVQLLLARLLVPSDFGLIGMATVFTDLIATIGDLGLGASLIQLRRERISGVHLDTAFWLSAAFNVIVFVVMATVVGPFAAAFYGQPLLRSIILVLGLAECIKTLAIIPRITLTRDLRFRAIITVETASAIVGGTVAVALAIRGAGVWSILAETVAAALTTVPLSWAVARWRARLRFSPEALSDILGFSVFDALQRTVRYFTQNIDYLLVGKMLGATPLGVYTLAFVMTDTFRQQIMATANRVMFPVYGKIQDDAGVMKAYYLKSIRYNSVLVGGVMLILFSLVRPLIVVVVGARWEAAAFPIQAMAIASTIHVIGGTSESVLRGTGRARLNFMISFIKTATITFPAFVILIYYFGINGAAVAVIIHKLASRIMYQHYMRKFIDVTEKDVFLAIRPMLSGLLAGIPMVFVLTQALDLGRALPLAGAVTLVGGAYGLAVYASERQELNSVFKKLLEGVTMTDQAEAEWRE